MPGLPKFLENSAEPLGFCRKTLQNISHSRKPVDGRFCRSQDQLFRPCKFFSHTSGSGREGSQAGGCRCLKELSVTNAIFAHLFVVHTRCFSGRGRGGTTNEHEPFWHKLFEHLRRQDMPAKCPGHPRFRSQGRPTFEGANELSGLTPSCGRPPIPPGNLRAQEVILCVPFSSLITSKLSKCLWAKRHSSLLI